MVEGSGGPWTSPGAQISAQPGDRGHAAIEDQPARVERPPVLSAERAERGVQLVSRVAGPVVFVLALGGILWLVAK